MKVSGSGISDANGIYTLTSGSAAEPLEYTKEGTSWVIARTMGYDPTHTHVNWSIRNTNTSAYAYASESFGGAEVKYPWELTWAIDPDGVEPVPTVEQYTPSEHNGVYVISGAGTADVNGTYWAVPTEEWSNIFNGPTLNNMQHCWTNGTYYLCGILSQYPYPSLTIQIMGYKYVDGVASGKMVNFYTCAPFPLDGDITTATFQVAHGDSPAPTIALA